MEPAQTRMILLTTLGAAFALSWLLTAGLRRYALAQQLMDVPNSRSSHSNPTPRGGGGAVVVSMTAACAWLEMWELGTGLPAGAVTAGVLVAFVGFIDDHRHFPVSLRLAGHCLAAVFAVESLGGAAPVEAFGYVFASGMVSDGLAVLFLVWMLNLTNFMDGIDGIAGAQVVTVCAVGVALHVLTGVELWVAPAVLGMSTAGFLVWNWAPARIFLGDVGSGYLGFMVGVLSLRAAWSTPALGWSWIILFGIFTVDATATLLRRASRRERLVEAHRCHAYQHLALKWRSHSRVASLVVTVNLVWLMPLAMLVATERLEGAVGLILAFTPLTIGVAALGAGASSPGDDSC